MEEAVRERKGEERCVDGRNVEEKAEKSEKREKGIEEEEETHTEQVHGWKGCRG